MVWLFFFFPFYTFFEFSKYSTENNIAFIIGQKGQCLLFSEPKPPLPLQCGNSAKILFLDSISERALGMLLGAAAEACHIWKPSIRMTSPLEPIQHKTCLQELAEIFGQNLEGGEPRKNWPKEERTGLLACRSPCIHLGLAGLCDQFLGKDYFPHLTLLQKRTPTMARGLFLSFSWGLSET